jgi:hypothetical protein
MGGRRHIPLTLLGLLTLLAGGGAVWAQLDGPDGATITVQNATAATYGDPPGSTSFTLDLMSCVKSGGTSGCIAQTRRISYVPGRYMVVYQTQPSRKLLGTVPPAGIAFTVGQYVRVPGGSSPWAHAGTTLTRTETLAAFSHRVTMSKAATGKVYETAVVRNGYLVSVRLKVVVRTQVLPNGQEYLGFVINQTYRIVRVNGKPTPALAS